MQRDQENTDDKMKTGNLFDEFRARRSTMPSLFGGRDPFDDPFFTRPFGSISGSGMFGTAGQFGNSSQVSEMKGPVIKELDSEDEGEQEGDGDQDKDGKNERSEASDGDCSNKDPIVEHPDDEDNAEKESENVSHRTNYNKVERAEPQNRSFSFQKVTYGGVDGTYFTATTSRRKGKDGALLEESKQADKTTGQASHRISRGLHDRDHSLLRKIDSDGKVDTMQTLHNLEEDELTGFEDAWRGNVEKHFPGWTDGSIHFGDSGVGGSRQITQAGQGTNHPFGDTGESFSTRRPHNETKRDQNGGKTKKVVRINIE
ncbi:uncharacterized protein LOC108194050 [Daucus carota subsp. sativus]|uniref:uncharacterized protein LOC108194050 n=1 Tax=Daucus carota subsp. sativus TaxID=79200 RepID=UPI0007EF6F14|nr:PREDICTED: uncharacterized protein LOC108194050 [Daucus carota subsp. sativus]